MSNKLFFIVFMLLWLGPIIGGVIVAKKKNRSPHWFWLGIWPGVGLWVFIIFLFLKPLEICENCKKIILWGSVNEYNQHFCDENCYEKYCKKNGYEAHPEELYKIKSVSVRLRTGQA